MVLINKNNVFKHHRRVTIEVTRVSQCYHLQQFNNIFGFVRIKKQDFLCVNENLNIYIFSIIQKRNRKKSYTKRCAHGFFCISNRYLMKSAFSVIFYTPLPSALPRELNTESYVSKPRQW